VLAVLLMFLQYSSPMVQPTSSGATFDFYISTTGNDSNAGTLANPWAITSLQDTNSNNSLIAAKRVGLIAGTYSLSGMTSGSHVGGVGSNYDYPILHLPAGSSGHPTYIGSSNSSGFYTARVATLDWGQGVSNTTNSMIGQNSGGSGFFTIDGLTVTGYTTSSVGGGTSSQSCKQIGYYPAQSAGLVTVQNCDMGNMSVTSNSSGSNDGPIFMDGSSLPGVLNVLVQNNKFHDVHKAADPTHVHAFEQYHSTGGQFLNNTIITCDCGIEGKVDVNGLVAAYNYFYNCGQTGGGAAALMGFDGFSSGSTVNTFHHNIFDTNPGAIFKIDVSSSHIAQPATFYNNTVYCTVSGSNDIWDLRGGLANAVTFHDNILVTTAATGGGSASGRLGLTSGDVAACDFNCYYPTNGNFTAMWALSGTAQNTLANWRTASGFDTNGINTNPTFSSSIVSGAGPTQFQLGGGSPCIGTGTGGANMGAWDGVVTQIGCNF
jgi:hypothetical protein